MSGKSEIVPGPKAVVVVVIRPVVVPITIEHTGIRSIIPIAATYREHSNILSHHPIHGL
jgi:hypothetical protein